MFFKSFKSQKKKIFFVVVVIIHKHEKIKKRTMLAKYWRYCTPADSKFESDAFFLFFFFFFTYLIFYFLKHNKFVTWLQDDNLFCLLK